MQAIGNMVFCVLLLLGSGIAAAQSPYLFVWAADEDKADSDFVAVIDALPESEAYGDILTTLPVGMSTVAHHSEHRMPQGGMLFVNGFRTGNTFVIDLTDPLVPGVAAHFTSVADLSFPHSFERLPNGNVLATFQNGKDGELVTGGLAELDPLGQVIRWSSASSPDFPEIRPYSLLVLPDSDLVISTTADMRQNPMEDTAGLSNTLQFWRLSDLQLLQTIELPPGPRGDEQFAPAEPRLMADGETLLVSTFRCGLYRVRNFDTANPVIEHVYTFQFENRAGENRHCALPVTIGSYWIQTVPARNALVSLDLSQLESPHEASAVSLGEDHWVHWIAAESDGSRILVTGYQDMINKLAMLKFDPANGQLELDTDFGDEGFIKFNRASWPHGESGSGIPHGAVFSTP
ncbi:MAG TPA: hypothetical protein VKN35_15850 [Xanthomonadales bacterium]|nr:hypothetical protein [Xanthomonadales bacterium]